MVRAHPGRLEAVYRSMESALDCEALASNQLSTRIGVGGVGRRFRRHRLQCQTAAVLRGQPFLVVDVALVGQPPLQLVDLSGSESAQLPRMQRVHERFPVAACPLGKVRGLGR